MNMKKIWADPVWSKVISWVICLALGSGALYAIVHWWEPFSTFLLRSWGYVKEDAAISRWLLWALILWALLTILLIGGVYIWRMGDSAVGWRSYTEDEFSFMHWRWKLDESGHPYNINAFCCACDFQLDIRETDMYSERPRTTYVCPCGKTAQDLHDTHDRVELRVTKLIQQKIRNGQWKDAKRR